MLTSPKATRSIATGTDEPVIFAARFGDNFGDYEVNAGFVRRQAVEENADGTTGLTGDASVTSLDACTPCEENVEDKTIKNTDDFINTGFDRRQPREEDGSWDDASGEIETEWMEQESVASSEQECEGNGMRRIRTESSNKVYKSLLSVIDKVDYENTRQAVLIEISMDAVAKGLAARSIGELKKMAALDWGAVSPSLVLMLAPFPELARAATQTPMDGRASAIAAVQAQIVKSTEYSPRLVPD